MTFDIIYNDITTNVLPKLAEWLTITKDYFMDLSGRYIQYLIISDSIYLIVNLILFILSIYYWIKLFKWSVSIHDDLAYENQWIQYLLLLIPIAINIICLIFIFKFWENLIKDLTIPELRIYEKYKSFNN